MTTGPGDQRQDDDPGAHEAGGAGGGQYGAAPYGSPEYGSPQYGAPEYGSPQYGSPQYGGPEYGSAGYGAQPYGPGGSDYDTSGGYGAYPPPPPPGDYQAYPAGGAADQMSGPGAPGGLGVRFGARVIDHLIIGIPYAIISGVLGAVLSSGIASYLVGAVIGIIYAIVLTGYFVYFETKSGQTLGKQLLHLRVEGPHGGLVNQTESLKRNGYVVLESIAAILTVLIPVVGFFLSGIIGIAVLVFLIVIAVTINNSPTKQGKHDEMAGGTRVVVTQ